MKRKPAGYWDKYENCYEEAKKYKTRGEFQKRNKGAYYKAWKNKWLDNYTWFEEKQKPKGYWNDYDRCYKAAKECSTKEEFQKRNVSAYNAARRNNWLDKFDWLVDGRLKLLTEKNDSVYKYYFAQTHSIYIGRTLMRRQKIRDRDHIYNETDAVAKYARKNGFAVPPMEIIEDNLTIEEGLTQEDYWKNYYKDRGYNVLNTAKTGVGSGSIGRINHGKWSREKVFEEAKKYRTKHEFEKGNGSAYQKAIKNGWIKEMDWFISGHINDKNTSKPVLQYTKDGQCFVAEYPSISEASRIIGISISNIRSVCKKKTKTAGGYIWKYAS